MSTKPKRVSAPRKAFDLFDTGLPILLGKDIVDAGNPMAIEVEQLHNSYRHGNFSALREALIVCQREQIKAPLWVVGACMRVVEALWNGGVTDGLGQSGNRLSRYLNDAKKFLRWQTVAKIRTAQAIIRSRRKRIPKDQLADLPEPWAEYGDVGTTLNDAFRVASDFLSGTTAFGAPATIRNSYKEVEKSFNQERYKSRFLHLHPCTLLLSDFGI